LVAPVVDAVKDLYMPISRFVATSGRPRGSQRAKAVYNYFVSAGIAAGRLQTVGNRMHDPIASNATADGRAMNRRVELQIVQ
jgi:hypothetical protein